MDIGNAIHQIRKCLKISRKQLAVNSGLSVTALYNIENNISFPSKNTIDRICSSLNVPISFILLYSIQEEDVPENKRDAVRYLITPLKALLLDQDTVTIWKRQ